MPPQAHPDPAHGFCCTNLATVTRPAHFCEGHPVGLIPFEDIIKAHWAQNKAEQGNEPIYVAEYGKKLKAVCWFAKGMSMLITGTCCFYD